MAAIGRRRSSRRRVGTTAVGRTRRRRRSVGSTSIGRTHRRRRRSVGSSIGRTRRRRRIGATGGGSTVKQVGMMAVGVAGGALLTHMALRPLEQHVVSRFPMAAKFMGAAEVLIGGYIALKAKNGLIKGVGWGVLGGGVHTMMHQFNIGKENPAIHGSDTYTPVPISGGLEARMTRMINTSRSGLVAGVLNGTDRTSNVAGSSYKQYLMNGTCDLDGEDMLNYYKS